MTMVRAGRYHQRMPGLPSIKHLPPYALTIPAWAVATGYTLLTWHSATRIDLQLPPGPGLPNGYRYEAQLGEPHATLLTLAAGAAVTLIGSALLRRAPLWALGLLLAGASATSLTVQGPLVYMNFLPVDIALYFIAAHRTRRASNAALAMAIGTAVFYTTVWAHPLGSYYLPEFDVILPCVIFWLVGSSSRQAREHAESLAAQTATAERLRISRELHDSVAHNIGIVAVLAGAAGRVIQTQPQEAREALSSIETTSRDTLTGLQTMLRALRSADEAGGAEQDTATPPAPGVADVDRLAGQALSAGVRVEVSWRGRRRPLPPEIDLSAYRIVQEAVTNVVRHSGADACRVEIGFEPEELAIEIVDDGRGAGHLGAGGTAGDGSTAEGGFGLLGMRERVAMLSGQFSAGPLPTGGFRVAARLPA